MCFSKPKIEKADPVAAPPPPMPTTPMTPVLNEASRSANADGRKASTSRRGRSAVTIPLISSSGVGVNIPN